MKSITYMLFALLVAFASCSHSDDEVGGGVYGDDYVALTLEISTGQNIQTRATEGPVAGSGDENKIYDIQVWAYSNGDGTGAVPVGYAEVKGIGSGNGTTTTSSSTSYADATVKLTLYLPKTFVDNPSSKVDLYFLGNYSAIMADAPSGSLTRSELEALTFGGDYFGMDATTKAPKATSVPAGGLPMSAIRKNLSLSEMLQVDGPLNLRYNETVLLKRAVSRVAFFFAKQTNMTAEVSIERVEIDGNVIPASEYVFPNPTDTDIANLPAGVSYTDGVTWANTTATTPLLANGDIAETADPALLRSDCASNGNATMTAQQYATFIEGKASQATPEATQVGYTYLRETGKKLTGKIYYTYGGTAKTATFTMERDNDFARNHTWIVYAYFLKEGLYVTPMVQPWIVGGIHSIYSKTSVQLYVDQTYNSKADGSGTYQYLVYDEAKGFDDWSDNYCAIAYGFSNGRPLYSPWMRLTTTTTNNLRLQLNNNNYGFVVYYPEYHNTENAYSAILDELTITAGTAVETNFYVVPKYQFNISNPPSKYVTLTLVERTSATGDSGGDLESLVGRLPWNSILPGAEDHTTALFYYVTPTEYNGRQTESGHELKEYPF